ncbi:MAG: hypothetical protein WCL06_13935 [Bacteroidota bacterium]
MNQKDILKDEANARGKQVLVDNNTELSVNAAWGPLRLLYDNKSKDIQKAIEKIFNQSGYVTFDKKLLKNIMINTFIPLLDKASNQFVVLDKPDLAKATDVERDYFLNCSNKVCIERARYLLGFVTDNSGILTELTPAEITSMVDSLKDFNDINNMPQSVIKAKKAQGTDVLKTLFGELDVIKHLVKKHIRAYNSNLLPLWIKENKIGKSAAARPISLNLHVTDAVGGVDLKKAECTITNGTKTLVGKTTSKGFRKYYGLESGLWNITVTLKNYESFKQTEVAIGVNKTLNMEVKLKKNTLPDALEGGCKVTVFNLANGNKLKDISMYFSAIDKTYVSDAAGLINVSNLAVGAYACTLSAEHVTTKFVSVSIDGGKTTEVSFGLSVV